MSNDRWRMRLRARPKKPVRYVLRLDKSRYRYSAFATSFRKHLEEKLGPKLVEMMMGRWPGDA